MSASPLGSDSSSSGGQGNGGSAGSAGSPRGEVPKGIATAIAEVSERATLLVREEIELAKAEVAEKAARLAKGAVVGVAAGIFFVTALFFVLVGCAWLLYYYLPIGSQFTYFWGFFAMALILVILGLIAGLIAARAVKRDAPPTPDMAIEEARRIRDTVSSPAPRDAPVSGARGDVGASSSMPGSYGAAVPHASAYAVPHASASETAPRPPTVPPGAAPTGETPPDDEPSNPEGDPA